MLQKIKKIILVAINNNIWFKRFFLLFFTSLVILGTAFSCSLPGGFLNNNNTITLGVLKNDPSIREDGFVKANAVINPGNQLNNQGLSSISVLKILRQNKDNLFILTREKGIFRTEDAGYNWKRIYIFPIEENANTSQINQKIVENDQLTITDIALDPQNEDNIYVSLLENKIAKIFFSFDKGQTFKEIYSEIATNIKILFLVVDPINPNRIYAILEKGALLRSLDAGLTWQKIRSFKDVPVQFGFIPEFNELFFILFKNQGLAISNDGGETWDLKNITKAESEIGEKQPKDKLDFGITGKQDYGIYEKIIPVTAGIKYDLKEKKIIEKKNSTQSWILIADRQIWLGDNNFSDFKKLVLPTQLEQVNLYDINYNPNSGLDQIYASVNNQLFITNNRGNSWITQDIINLSGQIGSISQILIDKENTDIIYLTLVDSKYTKNNGFFNL